MNFLSCFWSPYPHISMPEFEKGSAEVAETATSRFIMYEDLTYILKLSSYNNLLVGYNERENP